MTNIIFSVSKTPVTAWALGDPTTSQSIAATDPVNQQGTTLDIRNVNIEQATVVLEVTNTSGTIAVDVDGVLSLDGSNGTIAEADILSAIMGNGVYTAKLSDILNTNGYFHYLGLTLNKTNTGTCDVKLYLLAQGA